MQRKEAPEAKAAHADLPIGSDGVVVVDRNEKIISFSEEAERILRFPMNDAHGRALEEILGSLPEELRFALRDTLQEGAVHSNIGVVLQDSRYSNRRFIFNVSPLHSVQHEIAGAVITFRDVDEMQHLLDELSQKNYEILVERNKLASILNSINDGVFTIDMNWRITSINRAAQEITGYSEEEAVGKNWAELLRSGACRYNCPMEHTLKTGEPMQNVEVEICTKSGRKVPISVNTALLYDDEGRVIGAVETFRDLSEVRQLARALETRYRFANILGKSKPMQELYDLLENVVDTDATVLIQGESGTGKELVARALHFNGPRRNRPFVPVNCSALSENLLESELFGHEKGAFTGAIRTKPGRFELANGGTLFLDEVADMSPALQVKLLRVLDEQAFERVGGTQRIQVDVRIIAATNKDLRKEVREGRFREDLFYRLNVVPIYLPPLRERREDIPLLVEHFIERFNQKMRRNVRGISPEALDILMSYDWPGNIRELENAIEQAFVRCRGETLLPEHLPRHITGDLQEPLHGPISSLRAPLEETEKEILRRVLEETGQSRIAAARRLGISKATLWRKMKRYGLLD